ncbi:transcriptional regulator [Pasteurellaceae bacterium 15-036681]|nr:transcriptional regulator [Pasteurellaceae bacterium 15-036681]
MYDYKAMNVFVTVVEQGSMQAAAEKLLTTPSAVTQAIQKLENHLKIKLLHRTTRKLSLTGAGEAFYRHASQMQKSAEEAIKSVERIRSQPIGQLNITCVTGLMGGSLMANVFKSMIDNHPEFHLNLMFEDKIVDLVENRIDIAIRAGTETLGDNMIARRILEVEFIIVGHCDYFAEKGIPKTLDELAKADWISFLHNRYTSLNLRNENETREIFPDYRISCNSLYASRNLMMSGLGISIQPKREVAQYVASGELIQIFPEWKLATVPLYMVTQQGVQSEKVRIACKLITDYFKQLKIA